MTVTELRVVAAIMLRALTYVEHRAGCARRRSRPCDCLLDPTVAEVQEWIARNAPEVHAALMRAHGAQVAG